MENEDRKKGKGRTCKESLKPQLFLVTTDEYGSYHLNVVVQQSADLGL